MLTNCVTLDRGQVDWIDDGIVQSGVFLAVLVASYMQLPGPVTPFATDRVLENTKPVARVFVFVDLVHVAEQAVRVNL